jgi:micrococcal nuclease
MLLLLARSLPVVSVAVALAAGCAGSEPAGDPVRPDPPAGGEAVTAATATDTTEAAPQGSRAIVARVVDGDTIELEDGRRVRLLQVDAPEPGENECYSQEATQALRELLPGGTRIRLVTDPALDERDRYDRLLRYVFEGRRHVNLLLVQRGAASVWFFEGERGMHADRLLRAARNAKDAGRGLWGACPGTELEPGRAIATAP